MQFITFYNKLLRSRFLLRYAINNLKKKLLRSFKERKVKESWARPLRITSDLFFSKTVSFV